MRRLLILPVCLFFQLGFCQPKLTANEIDNKKAAAIDSADIYIAGINCNSAIVATTYFEKLLLDSNAQKIVSLKDGNVNDKLFALLGDTLKALATHIILTQRLEHNKGALAVEYVYDSSYKNILRVNFSFNKFNWYYVVNEGAPGCSFHFDRTEITKIKQYWDQRLKFCASKMYQQ